MKWLPFTVAAVLLIYLNCVGFSERTRGIGGDSFPDAFSPAYGWPFAAVAPANDEGASLIDASVLQGDTQVRRGMFADDFPHLAWNPVFIAIDLFVAFIVIGIAHLLGRWIAPTEVTPPTSESARQNS